MRRPLAVVAMSGGVDSSVAAALLLQDGYRVEGVSLRLWDSARRDARVCSDHRDAARVAEALGIAHTEIDQREAFERTVVRAFVAEYARGRTPNPCVACNGDFKLGVLLEWALRRGADFVATGHYARLRSTTAGMALCRARDARAGPIRTFCSRSVARNCRERCSRSATGRRGTCAVMPRPSACRWRRSRIARTSASAIPRALVRSRGMGAKQGVIVDEVGSTLGRHGGVESFTVGQRRGLGVAASEPLYVRSTRRRGQPSRSRPSAAARRCRRRQWVDMDGRARSPR